MGLISLLLQNSAGQMSVGLADGGDVLFQSEDYSELKGVRNIEVNVSAALAHSGKSIADIECVFVDIGPGGLGATRTTVAFANALGFARDISIIGINAFELIGFHAAQLTGKPVVCIRPAAWPSSYVGKFEDGQLLEFAFTNQEAVKFLLAQTKYSHAIAGKVSLKNLPEDGGSETFEAITNSASVESFLEVALAQYSYRKDQRRVYPITETF